MKLVYVFLALALMSTPVSAQTQDSVQASQVNFFFPDTIYHKFIPPQVSTAIVEQRLDLKFHGIFVGVLADNTFISNHTLAFRVKPAFYGVIGIGKNYKGEFQIVVPTEKGDQIIWRINAERRLF